MKILVIGPSASGKTFVAHALQQKGINAYDADEVEGLSNWYNRQGKKVAAPATAEEAITNGDAFLWSRKFLQTFLNNGSDIYQFGGSGNVFQMTDLFDKVFFLKVPPDVQQKRILSLQRNQMQTDFDSNGIVIWGEWLEAEAKRRNIPFIDATLSPAAIFEIIRNEAQ